MIESIIFAAVVTIGSLLAGWIIYHIGYSAGFKDGRDYTLDDVAYRTERQRKFTGGYE